MARYVSFIPHLAACIASCVLAVACTQRTDVDGERMRGNRQSTYDVWEYEILSAYRDAGQRFTVAVINDRRYETPMIKDEGIDGLSETDRKQIPVGATKDLRLGSFEFKSMYAPRTYTFEALRAEPGVLVRVHHVKSCNVDVEEKEKRKIVGDSSKGIITIPKLVKIRVREFTAPPCAGDDDRVVERPVGRERRTPGLPGSRPIPPEVIEAQKKSREQEIETERIRKLSQRQEEIERAVKKEASAIAKTISSPEGPPTSDADYLRQELCPGDAAMMRALKISEIKAERVEASRKEEKGYTSVHYRCSLTIVPEAGEPLKREDGLYMDLAASIRSIKPDEKNCLTISFAMEGGINRMTAEKMAKQLREALQIYLRHLAYEQAASK